VLARHGNLLAAAAENVARNGRGYAVAAAALIAGLVPLLCGVAISEGIKADALASVNSGADVYCAWTAFGRNAPMPREKLDALRKLPGVERAVPRIVGQVELGGELPVVVGIPLEVLREHPPEIDGELPQTSEGVLIGCELARVLDSKVGATIALESDSIRLFKVTGVMRSTSSLWSAKAIVCDLGEAAQVFGDAEHVTDVCLYTRAGYGELVADAAARLDPHLRVQSKPFVAKYVEHGMARREGIFTALFAFALALAIPAFAVLTYMGHSPRRREIGLLKSEGWSTFDVLEMVALENVLVSLLAAASALAIALFWLEVLRAPLIASLFVAELPAFPDIAIPSRFTPVPALLALVFSIVVTMTGSIYTTWRTSIARPADVLR
jgi:ABC-type lipoprotein release transport system permease subunit